MCVCVCVCVRVARYVSLPFVYRFFSLLPNMSSYGGDEEEGLQEWS